MRGFLLLGLLLVTGLSACAAAKIKPTSTASATPMRDTKDVASDVEDVAADEIAVVDDVFYVAPDGDDANPGTLDAPWATIYHAAATLRAGQRVYIREGTYAIAEQIRPKHAGKPDAWIVYAAYPGETPVIDADAIPVGPPGSDSPWPHDQGAFNIQDVHYIRVHRLTLRNSHAAGFMVRDSTYIELTNNTVDSTFSPGIAAWDSDHNGAGCEHIKFLGNTVINANTWDMAPPWSDRKGEPPHEAISVAGAQHFEVAYNHVRNCDKEGIDVKETSAHGRVHHNYVHHVARQGLYVDSWFGVLEDVEVDHNIVHDCLGAGMAISVEGGNAARDIRIHHNVFYNNRGTGFLFGCWGGDGLRADVQIYNNTIHHNGYGPINPGTLYHWITGGMYLFSANLEDIVIRNNIVSDNAGFQIGYSDRYLEGGEDITTVLSEKRVAIENNLIYDDNDVTYPVYAGWTNNFADIYAIDGVDAILLEPLFVAPLTGDFTFVEGADIDVGAFPGGMTTDFWWKSDFPPEFRLTEIPVFPLDD